ncbi:Mobile element protein [Methanosarcina siciliae C2J]|uniref:Mobile element protein n=2 Tax=Methanosarcina siciliae C2J TaxID=1434118 RepID=A0A0E3PRC3_9EURY|nr:IS1182 family transposase [Methanosarcina siciliae]AKB34596.1 Mobile element protein [Methanosarcina siciliae C2J]AKB35004.1 Mobile element protein [Methanosarcina siciliae C2J]AKB35084.1 Mobile element protein [Methanosarcina siciliae C2J]AKB35316.1 Mobile element protein [Methanosarcina siciliae C2J]AKB37085.1 Mobile element protein [Methanosarcina siciliae C2J]
MFKRYDQKQQFLLPFNLEEFVPENHIARVLNDIIDVIDINSIESTYSEEGCPAYHPRLLLKILLYGYLINIRSSRKIEQMTQTDTAFMYLAAMQKPDFHTICRFRSTHLGPIKEIFSQVVTFCKEMDLIGSSISIDGTKVKANASPRQSKSSDALEKEIDKILKESIETDKHEDEIYGDSTPYQIPEELVDKKKRLEKIKAAKKKLDEEKLKKVNITDNDARIMKHKDGSKKPSYNCQVAVDEKEQIIVAADVVNEENDLHQMEPMIQNVKNTLGYKPTIVLADAGYFSYDNVEFLLNEEIDAYIPDNFYEVEKRGKSKKFRKSLFTYDEKKDCYYCPAAFEIPFTRIQKRKEETDLRYYVCSYCSFCVLKNACTESENRTISRDPREHLMEDMRAKLNTEEGTEQYQNRMCTVEPVFGQMKQDRGFREFLLRGKRKTKIEFVMMCTVHNISKIADFMKREGKKLKEILNMITGRGNECGNRWESVAGMAHNL